MNNYKEWIRKKIVYLKRNVHVIPLFFILICCLVYNLNLSAISDTTAIIYTNGMGITMFVVSLFSYLSFITYLQAFPKRKKIKKFSVFLTYFMLVLSLFLNGYYYYCILYGTEIRTDPAPIVITSDKMYIVRASNTIIFHSVLIFITLILMSILPVFKKLIMKINTIKKEDIYE